MQWPAMNPEPPVTRTRCWFMTPMLPDRCRLSQGPRVPGGGRTRHRDERAGYRGGVDGGQNLLGDFLRARRELVSPEQVGISLLGVRRVPGLRREGVAMLAR